MIKMEVAEIHTSCAQVVVYTDNFLKKLLKTIIYQILGVTSWTYSKYCKMLGGNQSEMIVLVHLRITLLKVNSLLETLRFKDRLMNFHNIKWAKQIDSLLLERSMNHHKNCIKVLAKILARKISKCFEVRSAPLPRIAEPSKMQSKALPYHSTED